jgi:hypothetical protein
VSGSVNLRRSWNESGSGSGTDGGVDITAAVVVDLEPEAEIEVEIEADDGREPEAQYPSNLSTWTISKWMMT